MGSSSAKKGVQSMRFLHGDLSLHIVEARSLPNMDVLSHNLRRCFTPCCSASSTKDEDIDHGHHRSIISSDAYVTVVVPQCTLARTHVIKNNVNPKWDQKFQIPLAHPVSELEFRIKDNDVFGAELIGSVRISASDLSSGRRIHDWFPILKGSSSKPPKPDTALHLDLTFTPFESNPAYQKGAREISDVYFPMRKGGKMKLYQDAHVASHGLPAVELEGGVKRIPSSCWEDICHAISEAHHMIYIVGWSVFHKIKLIREATKPLPRGGDLTLGELLKYKSEEGVRVLLLVWDDKTSHDKLGFKTEGVMFTHDEETKRFFKHSSVTCVLAPRYASKKMGVLKQQVVGTIFTHHQKCVILDTQAAGNDRKVTAFVGGLDLCDGRYDTPEHRLFRDLDTVFKDDFHNPTYPAGTKMPREPWHDLHCRIDGPAAYDLLVNFHQRWRKSTKQRRIGKKLKESTWKNDALLKIERISWIRCPPLEVTKEGVTVVPPEDPSVYVTDDSDPNAWHVQIFRSIDSGSLKGFPKTAKECERHNLTCAKNLVVEKSIQLAYIQAIRSAQHFVYIENQYFLGSSFAWPGYKNAGADNLIPIELALKIASKIRARERFAVYVVIPMWPEGIPTSEVMQEILFWQSQTMEMMYTIIAREMEAMGMKDGDPQDYLNFFCLGNREEMPKAMDGGGGAESEAWKKRRFMIYVHAKGMIVDDEYVIIGSANINQRSMAGSKDSEVAMGAFQRGHTWWEKSGQPRGEVYGYRMGLWGEHMGERGLLEDAASLETVRTVRGIGEANWRAFAGDDFRRLDGHLLKYPLSVSPDGKVSPLPGYELFPDIGGTVIGAHSLKLPDALTT